ncbi:MAG: YgfZ/GcvT domain-containing protein [Acidimicrobiales bacterium]
MIERSRLDVVTVTGAQAESYLQGQMSQNVVTMSVGDCRRSLLLQPQGHLVAWLRVVRTGPEAFALIADPGAGATILARLERFLLGTKATLALESVDVVAVRASENEGLPSGNAIEDGRLSVVPLVWPDLHGVDLFGAAAEPLAGEETGQGLLEGLRIGAGIPLYGADYDDKTVPAALGVVDLSTDFTKGCYTGQELVARMDSRGNNSPRQLRVVSAPGSRPAVGTEGLLDGEAVAVLTSVTAVGEGWVALASVKRSALDAETVLVEGAEAVLSRPLSQSGAVG